jgi:antitoxin HicB
MMYLCELTPDDNGTFLVTCPAFPEVTTFGEDRAQALLHAIGALEEAIAARIADDDSLPRPATEAQMKRRRGVWVRLPLLTSLKAVLYMALREQHMSRAELARQLGWHREQVDRLFRLNHASRLDQIEAALEKLHQRVDVRVREMA